MVKENLFCKQPEPGNNM